MPVFRRTLLPLTVLSLALALAACQGPQETLARPTPGSTSDGLSDDVALSTPGSRATEAIGLRGLAARDLLAKLGDPNFRRRETPAEVWQYFGPGCVLDVFLYDEKDAQRVAHVELRSRTLTQGAEAACLSQLLAGKRDLNS